MKTVTGRTWKRMSGPPFAIGYLSPVNGSLGSNLAGLISDFLPTFSLFAIYAFIALVFLPTVHIISFIPKFSMAVSKLHISKLLEYHQTQISHKS